MKLRICVTKNDIKNGKKCDKRECPIGHAISRSLEPIRTRGWEHSIWGNAVTIFSNYEYGFDTALPKKAIAFVKAFDSGEAVEPFKFQLVVPSDFFCETT